MSSYYEIHQVTDQKNLKEFIEQFPFATIVSNHNRDYPSIVNAPIIFNDLVPEFHIANNNPDFEGFQDNSYVRAVFIGPNAPVSPSWYLHRFLNNDRSHTAPTWNYLKIEIKGRLQKMNTDELKNHLEQLVIQAEKPNDNKWNFDEINSEFLESLINYITGFKITNFEITGIFKASQDQSEQDQIHIINHLRQRQFGLDVPLATLMEDNLPNKKLRD